MGKASKEKGSRRELEFAKLMGGTKTPLSGAVGGEYSNDVKALGLEWEVKARKEGWKTLYDLLEDEREQPDALALKADRKDWLVVMKASDFKRLMEGRSNE
ncbi:hypothetical protein B0H94_11833 [Salsuginibacillus halophilus]|uniref:Uncharacterized protein n=1 Tax=Salsuginibacillus halophilus TaxID=517424 RepID=A0A2P8H695_9BACI|nr:hypothetical protein [Salsuginibacillus halophilus]PSL41720.1 hypothetical protein B0H94_11833 [Salsuginibacillus halophilus]